MKKIYYCENCKKWRGSNKECPECGEETVEREIPKARGDYYFIDKVDKPLNRVTNVLSTALSKPGLEFWKRKVSVEKALETMEKDKAMAAIYEKRDKAGKSGSDIHKIISNILSGGDVNWDEVQKEPKIRGWLKFHKDYEWDKTLLSEQAVYDEELGVAGTLDALIEKDGEKIIIDWKTGKNVYDETQLQLSAYAEMIDEDIDRLWVVHLKEDAYDLVEFKPDFETFKAVLRVFHWMEQ